MCYKKGSNTEITDLCQKMRMSEKECNNNINNNSDNVLTSRRTDGGKQCLSCQLYSTNFSVYDAKNVSI